MSDIVNGMFYDRGQQKWQKLFLVEGIITELWPDCDDKFTTSRIVMAESTDDAREKFRKYWEITNPEVEPKYYVTSTKIHEMIV